ncbi:MAG: hypothetical protein M3539_05385 [Acidobacteriota bacterium]|nr:hypothetical protein [Acidobacteriota bacterium]
MTIPRRVFLKTGILTSILAGTTAKFAGLTAAQRLTRRADAPTPYNVLDYYNKATFQSYINSDFRIYADGRYQTDVRLVLVEDLPGHEALTAPDECFRLLFSGPAKNSLPQGTYDLRHAALGTFPLFIVPMRVDGNRSYEAIFNRRLAGYVGPTVLSGSGEEPAKRSKKKAVVDELENRQLVAEPESPLEGSTPRRKKLMDW